MKSLKDYFSSPKSSDVSLNDSASAKPESPVEMELPFKRKSKKSLSNKSSKRKKLSADSSIQPVNTSQNSSIGLDESVEEFDLIQPKSSKKRKKKSENSKAGKTLSLKKRKSVQSDENLEVNKTQEQLSDSRKNNFFNQVKDKSGTNEKSIEKINDLLKDTNLEQLSLSIKGNFFEKVIDKNNDKSVKCERNAISVIDTNTDKLSSSIKDKFLVKVKDKTDNNDGKSVKRDSDLKLVKDRNSDTLSSSIKDKFFVKVKDKTDNNDGKSVKHKNDLILVKDENSDPLSSSIKDKNDGKSVVEGENDLILVKDTNSHSSSSSIKDMFSVKVRDKGDKSDDKSVKSESESLLEKDRSLVKGNALAKLADKSVDSDGESGKKRKKSKNKTSLAKTDVKSRKKIEVVEPDKESRNEQDLKGDSKQKYEETNSDVKLSEVSANISKGGNYLNVVETITKINDDEKRVKSNSDKVVDHKVNGSSLVIDISMEKSVPQENSRNMDTSVKSSVKKKNPKVSGVVNESLVADEIPSESKRKRKRKSEEVPDDIKNEDGEVSTPEMKKSLLNYFNKVEKSAVVSLSEEKRTIKVEAIVHEPRSTERSTKRPIVKRKVRKCRKQPDFDLITSEEDASFVDETPGQVVTPKRPSWQMRIALQSPRLNEVVNLDEESNTCSEMMIDEGETSTSIVKEDSDVIVLDDDSKDVQIVSGSQVSKTPSLKGAGTFAAYFGAKTAGKKDKKPEERSVATKLFLQSPAPPIIKKIIQDNASEVVEGLPAPFPVHSHVRQQDELSSMWNLPICELNLKSPALDVQLPSDPQFTSLCDLKEVSTTNRTTSKTVSTKSEINNATKLLKEKESTIPIKKMLECFRGMKKNSSVCELWNEKYRPKTTEEVLIENTNVRLLSNWLNTFQSNQANGSDSESSGDEFINDKDEKVCKYGNTALLVGPPGVGKTAAVYAAAKQNGYQVLELNASCNRNGKKVYLEFSEATQSHKVETKSLFKSKSRKKDKNKQSNKKSLLLIEDSDLLFNDLDDGYVNCLSLLQSSSKRPLVLVANDPNCKHLMKLIPSRSTMVLPFERPCPHKLSCFLKSMSLVEGIVLPQEACDLLVESVKGDLRKAVVNLQFYGPFFKQLDRRKLRLLNDSLSSFKDSSFETKDEALATVKRSKTLTTFDLLSSKKDCSRFSWFRESTTVESRLDDALVDSLRNDIAEFLSSSITTHQQPFSSYCNSLSAGDELSEVVDKSVCLGRRAIACDYSSSLRHIARTERSRLSLQTKRNKRFFNHLHNLGFDTSDQRTLDNLCSTLCDDSEDRRETPPDFDDISIND